MINDAIFHIDCFYFPMFSILCAYFGCVRIARSAEILLRVKVASEDPLNADAETYKNVRVWRLNGQKRFSKKINASVPEKTVINLAGWSSLFRLSFTRARTSPSFQCSADSKLSKPSLFLSHACFFISVLI